MSEDQTLLRSTMGGFCPRCGGPLLEGRCANPGCTLQSAPPVPRPPKAARPLWLLSAIIAVGAVVLVVIGAVALNSLRGGSAGTQTVAETQSAGQGDAADPSSPTRSVGVAPQPSSSATGPRTLSMGAEARLCTSSNGTPYSEVWAGVEATTCPFSDNVAAAYRAAGPSTTVVRTLRVHSPVTDLDYDVRCEPTIPVRCTTDTGATVYVVR